MCDVTRMCQNVISFLFYLQIPNVYEVFQQFQHILTGPFYPDLFYVMQVPKVNFWALIWW